MTKDPDIFEGGGRLAAADRTSFSGISVDILLGGDHAPMTVMDMSVDAGAGGPAHISQDEDKVFRIAEGRLLFLVGEKRIAVAAGDTVFVPKGTVHGFATLDDSNARMTLVSTPARHDRFFLAMGALSVPHTPDAVAEVCARYGQRIVGPVLAP